MNWNSAYLESRILSASPTELVGILYEHAIVQVGEARRNLACGDVAARAKNIAKAIAIISELQSSLDPQAGGEIAINLERLYEYMIRRLTEGSLQKADRPLAEVGSLLATLEEGWLAINCPPDGSGASRWASEETPALAGWSA